MRVPYIQVYRAFPELDRFGDEQCMAFVKTAQRAEPGMNSLLTGAFVGAGILGIVLMLAGCAAILAMFPIEREEFSMTALLVILVAFAAIGLPAVAWLFARDWWLRRAIARRIQLCACTECHYSLLGLRAIEGAVQCPECGFRHALASLGLKAADLLPPDAGRDG